MRLPSGLAMPSLSNSAASLTRSPVDSVAGVAPLLPLLRRQYHLEASPTPHAPNAVPRFFERSKTLDNCCVTHTARAQCSATGSSSASARSSVYGRRESDTFRSAPLRAASILLISVTAHGSGGANGGGAGRCADHLRTHQRGGGRAFPPWLANLEKKECGSRNAETPPIPDWVPE